MKTLLLSAAAAAVAFVPSAAMAQAIPPAVIAVVDLDKVSATCNACKTAATALRSQVTAVQNREKALAAPLEAEQKSIQSAIDGLNGKEPDAALQARIKAFQTKQQQGAQELASQQQQIQRNSDYVKEQILNKLAPVYQQVMQKRGANVLLEVGSTLAAGASMDVTNDVLAGLNAALPTIATTAPASSKPQGR